MKELKISSALFDNNDWIPDRCSGYGEDQSPDLKVEGVPEETVTMAVIMDDLDHPVFREYYQNKPQRKGTNNSQNNQGCDHNRIPFVCFRSETAGRGT